MIFWDDEDYAKNLYTFHMQKIFSLNLSDGRWRNIWKKLETGVVKIYDTQIRIEAAFKVRKTRLWDI